MRILKWIGTALLFLVVAVCFAPTLIPPFLDDIYYRGPDSDHFRNGRFFNPGETRMTYGAPQRFFNRWASGTERAQWPQYVPVRPSVPPARVSGREMRVTWIGHATVLIQTQDLNILTDPIWSERASPFSFIGPKRVRAPGVRFADLPKIDLILISHNHYDHMDLPTLERLWQRDRPLIVTSLGNGAIIGKTGAWVVELDWGKSVARMANGQLHRPAVHGPDRELTYCDDNDCQFQVFATRNHHWSSRWGTDRNRALWSAFTISLPDGDIFYSGDTGYGDGSWVREAAARRPYRFAIIPIGAYEPRDFMKTNHVNPEEAVRIFEMLNPARGLGIHWGTFQLTFEPIDEPRQRLAALKRQRGIAPDRFVAVEAGESISVPPI